MKRRPPLAALSLLSVIGALGFIVISIADSLWIIVPSFVFIVLAGSGALWIVGWDIRHRIVSGRERKQRKECPFDTYFTPEEYAKQYQAERQASSEAQRLRVTLEANILVNVIRVRVVFDGHGTMPRIDGLYDWGWGEDVVPRSVYPPQCLPSGAWYWEYRNPLQRPKGHTVKLGIRFVGAEWFDGRISLEPALIDQDALRAPIQLPFKLNQRQVPDTEHESSQSTS